ncbi:MULTISPECIES: hypothetical protein [Rodentibacter]|uniref:hypothetical protein n=1 Tax=Rodentibacter TaxID=1960084 RepID=UPI001CFDEC00|nr:hypothetical protein [Rodentibacter sp. JRC1]GJI55873.1 hypothetical protein HEMROJRC1_09850 [Rodentibacter sp. JRC1]
MRGKLTDEIKQKSNELLGYEITQQELRLMPYVNYCLLNRKNISRDHIKREELDILTDWEEKGYIKSPISELAVKKEFFFAMNALIFLGYVANVGSVIEE